MWLAKRARRRASSTGEREKEEEEEEIGGPGEIDHGMDEIGETPAPVLNLARAVASRRRTMRRGDSEEGLEGRRATGSSGGVSEQRKRP